MGDGTSGVGPKVGDGQLIPPPLMSARRKSITPISVQQNPPANQSMTTAKAGNVAKNMPTLPETPKSPQLTSNHQVSTVTAYPPKMPGAAEEALSRLPRDPTLNPQPVVKKRGPPPGLPPATAERAGTSAANFAQKTQRMQSLAEQLGKCQGQLDRVALNNTPFFALGTKARSDLEVQLSNLKEEWKKEFPGKDYKNEATYQNTHTTISKRMPAQNLVISNLTRPSVLISSKLGNTQLSPPPISEKGNLDSITEKNKAIEERLKHAGKIYAEIQSLSPSEAKKKFEELQMTASELKHLGFNDSLKTNTTFNTGVKERENEFAAAKQAEDSLKATSEKNINLFKSEWNAIPKDKSGTEARIEMFNNLLADFNSLDKTKVNEATEKLKYILSGDFGSKIQNRTDKEHGKLKDALLESAATIALLPNLKIARFFGETSKKLKLKLKDDKFARDLIGVAVKNKDKNLYKFIVQTKGKAYCDGVLADMLKNEKNKINNFIKNFSLHPEDQGRVLLTKDDLGLLEKIKAEAKAKKEIQKQNPTQEASKQPSEPKIETPEERLIRKHNEFIQNIDECRATETTYANALISSHRYALDHPDIFGMQLNDAVPPELIPKDSKNVNDLQKMLLLMPKISSLSQSVAGKIEEFQTKGLKTEGLVDFFKSDLWKSYSEAMIAYVPIFDNGNEIFNNLKTKLLEGKPGIKDSYSAQEQAILNRETELNDFAKGLITPVQRMPRWKLFSDEWGKQNALKTDLVQIPHQASSLINTMIAFNQVA